MTLFSNLPAVLVGFRDAGVRLDIDDPLYQGLHHRITQQLKNALDQHQLNLAEESHEELWSSIVEFSEKMKEMKLIENYAVFCAGSHGMHSVMYAYLPLCCDVYRTVNPHTKKGE